MKLVDLFACYVQKILWGWATNLRHKHPTAPDDLNMRIREQNGKPFWSGAWATSSKCKFGG
jgi:hypothetical protein